MKLPMRNIGAYKLCFVGEGGSRFLAQVDTLDRALRVVHRWMLNAKHNGSGGMIGLARRIYPGLNADHLHGKVVCTIWCDGQRISGPLLDAALMRAASFFVERRRLDVDRLKRLDLDLSRISAKIIPTLDLGD